MTSHRVAFPIITRAVVRTLTAGVFLSILTFAAATPSRPASAQEASLSRDEVVRQLGDRHGEATVGLGIADNGGVIELFSSRDGTTWTIVLTMPDGRSYVVATGESWTKVAPVANARTSSHSL